MNATQLACRDPHCTNTIAVDPRHVDNLTAAGWQCSDHRSEVPC